MLTGINVQHCELNCTVTLSENKREAAPLFFTFLLLCEQLAVEELQSVY